MSDLPKKKKKKKRFVKAPPLPDFDMTPLYSADPKARRRRAGSPPIGSRRDLGEELQRVSIYYRAACEENAALKNAIKQMYALAFPPPKPLTPKDEADIAQIFGGM